jgi:predicted DNA-binding mobile mystery protein A
MADELDDLMRRQLSELLSRHPAPDDAPRPAGGWVAAVRTSLGMPGRALAARMGIVPSGVTRLEQRERDETITLGTLRAAARAMGCDLVYAIVPAHRPDGIEPAGLLDAVLDARARRIAEAELGAVAHSMALEAQAPDAAALEAQVRDRVRMLLETPRALWDRGEA